MQEMAARQPITSNLVTDLTTSDVP